MGITVRTLLSCMEQYFDKRDDLILAVDAAQEGIKRIDVAKDRVWNRATFSWEPQATMWYTLGNLFFKCNDMIPAVAAMETSLYFGRYRTDVRDKVTQWHPTQWSSPLASEISSQVKIAALLRGVWGRDKAKRHKVWVIQDAMDQYHKSPYTSLRARKVLVKFMAETYVFVEAVCTVSDDVDGTGTAIRVMQGSRRSEKFEMPSLSSMPSKPLGRRSHTHLCRDLSTCLQTAHFQLRHLIVEDNNLTDVGAMHVASAIGDYFFGRYGHLERLVLGRVGLTDAACQAFGQALSINTVLRTLDLHGNRIHDEGASALATGFHKSRTLQTLDLSENGVGTVGAKALFRAMETSAVMTLVLLNNNVKNDVMGPLAALLKAKDQGCAVDLHGNLIHADNMVEIQTWFTPECPDEAIQFPLVPNGTAFDEAKRKLFAPRNAKGVGKLSKDPLKELRRERRAIPLARTPKSVSQLLKLPVLSMR
ncbi:hypothetical protein DYB32_001102 [Aphanomyces invadans]|uniref:Uncharacterized protein n=1 Tax=Aphanomyces invadans TaxID=157072 RepID=A0A418B7I0_9STRA|nr:hypothetical protein DYB32_001102 [Aphanomyces invadans]